MSQFIYHINLPLFPSHWNILFTCALFLCSFLRYKSFINTLAKHNVLSICDFVFIFPKRFSVIFRDKISLSSRWNSLERIAGEEIDFFYNDVKCGKIHVTLNNYDWLDIFPGPIQFRVTFRIRIWRHYENRVLKQQNGGAGRNKTFACPTWNLLLSKTYRLLGSLRDKIEDLSSAKV